MCKICSAGMVGAKWTIDVMHGRKTLKEMAEYFGVNMDEAWEHVNMHQVPEDMMLREDDDTAKRFEKLIRLLEDWVDMVAMRGQPDPSNVKSLTALVRELRQAMMDYAEFQGKIQRGQVVLQVQQVQQKVQELTMVVLEEVCDGCRERIVKRLEQFA